MLIAFEGISRPIALVGCADLRARFEEILPSWRFAAAPPQGDPIILIRRDGERYRLESPWLAEPFHDRTEVGTVCAFILDLIAAYVAEHPSLFCLHCGAAQFDGRLVLFPGSYHAGKSTLVARLAAAGIPVYTDDVLPVTSSADQGVALGIAPRLRLPLPRGAGQRFRRFVARHRGPSNRRYLYLKLPPGTLAAHGRTAPIGAFVLLGRQPGGGAELAPAGKGRVLQRVILQHFARSVGATEIVDRLGGLVKRVPGFVLRYSRLDDAVALLQDRFATWPSAGQEESTPTHRRRLSPWQGRRAAGAPSRPGNGAIGPHFMRHPAVVLHEVDDDLFLVDPRDQSIYHLNPVGAGLWRLLCRPTAAKEAIDVLQAAFPDADRRQIEGDVRAVLADLLANDLIGAHDGGDAAGAAELTFGGLAGEG